MRATSETRQFPVKIVLTPEQEKWLVAHYKHTKNADIMARLGLSHSTLHRFAKELGLKKSRQYMRKAQLHAARLGYEACVASGRYESLKGTQPPGVPYFKKGVSNKDRLSPARYKSMLEKRLRSWKETRAKDKARFTFGLEQKTKMRFVQQSKAKIGYRHNMKKRGYIVNLAHNVFYYPDELMRHPKAEANGAKHGIRFLPLPKEKAVSGSCAEAPQHP